jgi:quercetin dioxygenase-like cupin family protein
MATTFIKTGDCARVAVPGAGEAADVLNEAICGAKNVRATLRWLRSGDRLDTEPKAATHQLVYVMDGRGVITLGGTDYPVGKGAGVYCGPGESAGVRPDGDGVKLFHLVVPEVADRA